MILFPTHLLLLNRHADCDKNKREKEKRKEQVRLERITWSEQQVRKLITSDMKMPPKYFSFQWVEYSPSEK